MRVHGTLTKWNDDRGFGFITPAKASSDIFVHISAFPRDGVRPRIDELISFEIEAGKDGRKRAVRVMRPRQRSAPPPTPSHGSRRTAQGWGGRALAVLFVTGLGTYGYFQYKKQSAVAGSAKPEVAGPAMPASRVASYSCDGRTMCSQMSSCDEATYFIRNCPDTQMDGDHDGVPCESQWCQ